jgi:ABC-type transport system involved in cytochrome c biogenesis permease subunit
MTHTTLQGVSHTCFGLSYLLAFGLELARLRWPRPSLRTLGLAWGGIGIATHTFYLAYHHPAASAPYGSLLLLAWVLAVFYLYGSLHHIRQAWAIFVLPVVIVLVALSFLLILNTKPTTLDVPSWLIGEKFWGAVHGTLLLGSTVGVSVAFLASIMYLVQARRLRQKSNPLGGLAMLSLERLEFMNRRAVNIAFPLLTCGLVLGAVLLKREHDAVGNWISVKVLGTTGLWAVCLLLLYMRYATAVSGRRLAWLAIVAFGLMLMVLTASHPFAEASK